MPELRPADDVRMTADRETVTDHERLVALLTDFGIHFEERPAEEFWPGRKANPPYPRPDNPEIIPHRVVITSEGGPKNDGYDGFQCGFEFEDDGRFRKVTVEE